MNEALVRNLSIAEAVRMGVYDDDTAQVLIKLNNTGQEALAELEELGETMADDQSKVAKVRKNLERLTTELETHQETLLNDDGTKMSGMEYSYALLEQHIKDIQQAITDLED